MPIQLPNFQRIGFAEANPALMGAQQGQEMMQNFLKFPQDLQAKILANQIAQAQAKYAEPMAKGKLTELNQQNQWNPKIWQSEIGLRGAQTGLANTESQLMGPKAQAQIALEKAQAGGALTENQMNQLKLHYLQQVLGGQNPSQGNSASPGGGSSPQGMSPNGGQDQTQAGQTNSPQSTNQSYGIPIPMPTQDDIKNKMLLGIDTFSDRQNQAYKQQQQQKDQFTKEITNSIQSANSAQKAQQALNIFNAAMNKADFKGPYWGTTPSSGWRTGYHPFSKFENEQIADNAASNLIPGAMAEIREAMGGGKFSVIDMQAAQRIKVDRSMTDKARENASKFMNGVFSRMKESPQFYQVLGNPKSGADKQTADLLWQSYQNDFPMVDKDGETYKPENLNKWALYTTPKAIASVKATGTYSPSRAEKGAFMLKIPDKNGGYHIAPVPEEKLGYMLQHGAKPL